METLKNWIRENKGLVTGICVGITIAVLFLTIGFWATLLIAVCVGVGAFFGKQPQTRERLSDWFISLFEKKDKQP